MFRARQPQGKIAGPLTPNPSPRSGARGDGRRRGVILLVVLSLLTLFAVVGLTFVLYAESQATSARVYREAQNKYDDFPDESPDILLAWAVGQVLYDSPDDVRGVASALRGHSVARLLYGLNEQVLNDKPFNGVGRLRTGPVTYGTATSFPDEYTAINYTYYFNDGFLRDPERLGSRVDYTQQPKGPYTGGFNVPYTYPDLNNMFLGAVRADGTVLARSFHRDWTGSNGFGPLDPANPNWFDTTNPALKYLVLRPRPVDQLLP